MLEEVLSHFDKDQKFSRDFTAWQIITAIFEHETSAKAIGSLGQTPQTFNKHIRRLFPGVKLSGKQTWKSYLLDNYSNYKRCTSCNNYKQKSEFGLANDRYDGLNNKCLSCDKTRVSSRKALVNNRIPLWANLDKISEIYLKCPKGMEVDHIVPLLGTNICGLHVENNLQYLTPLQNQIKSNKFNGESND